MPDDAKLSPLDRFLRLFTEVRPGEGVTVLLLASNVFLLLTCYYILKSVRDGLILAGSGAEVKSYTSALQVLVLAAIVPLYSRLADRVPRRRLINSVTAVFVASFTVFAVIVLLDFQIGVVFFVWVSIFNVMIVAQFWAFANDLYLKEEGERLFPIVAFGQSLGAVVGATYARLLVGPFGVPALIIAAAVILAGQVIITNVVDRRERRAKEAHLPREETSKMLSASGSIQLDEVHRMLEERERQRAGEAPREPAAESAPEEPAPGPAPGESSGKGGFALVFGTRYLLMIGLLMLLLNFVNTTGGYILDRLVAETATEMIASGQAGGLSRQQFITQYMAGFFQLVNIVGLVVQLFLVSRVVKYLGVAFGLMVLPAIALGAYAMIAFIPLLTYVRWAKTAENATDYSLNNTVRNMLFLPATREQKYKAKQAIDSFFVRVGDTMSALLVLTGTTWLALSTSGFAYFNLAATIAWLALAFFIGREYRRMVAAGETPS